MENLYEYKKTNSELTETIRLAMDGDEYAYEELLKKYAPYILVLVHNFAGARGEEEDIAQEVSIQVYRSITSLESPYAFTAWLRRIVVNVTNNYVDKHRRHWNHGDLDEALSIEDKNADHIPQEAAAKSDTRKRLASLIAELPRSQRTALFMYYYEDMSYKDIAQTLGIKVGTVATNLKKARAKLEKSITEQTRIENAAFGGVIISAFDYEAAHYVTETAVGKFTNSLLNANHTGVSRGIPAEHIGKATQSNARNLNRAAGIFGALLLAGSVLFAILPRETETPLPAPAPAKEAAAPQVVTYGADNASLTLYSESGQPNVNPTSADLTIGDNEGVCDGWRITNETGAVLASGSGLTAAIPQTLAAGKYYLTYSVTAHEVATATIKKEFYID